MKKKRFIGMLPNLISGIRLCMIPWILWACLKVKNSLLAVVLLIVSGLSDILDGQIARRWGAVSDLGKILDPVADKLTQGAVLFCLLFRFPSMGILLGVLAVKELSVGILGMIALRKCGKVHGAVWHGKVTTVLLYTTMGIHLLWSTIPLWLSRSLTGLCLGMMLLSAVLYAQRNLRLMKGNAEA